MPKNKDIQYLPPGYTWIAAGKEKWTTSQGKESTERHAIGPNGETLSVRQVQNRQKEARQAAGQQIPTRVRRTGKIRTIKGGGPQNKRTIHRTKGGKSSHSSGISLDSPVSHGRTESAAFYTLDDLRDWVAQNGQILEHGWASFALVSIRYTERLVATTKIGSDVLDKNGYASLTPFHDIGDFVEFVSSTQSTYAEPENPWHEAYTNIARYDMSGSNARVYFEMKEK